MAETPKSIQVEIDWDRQEIKDALANAEQVGEKTGYERGLNKALEYIEDVFMNDPGRPDRGTPKYEAILEIARGCGKFIREELKRVKK